MLADQQPIDVGSHAVSHTRRATHAHEFTGLVFDQRAGVQIFQSMPLRDEGYFLRIIFLTHATVGWSDADQGTHQAALPQLERRNFDAHKRIFKTNAAGDADQAQK